MVSTYNAITRRPHVPRERGLRQIMHDQGLMVDVDPPAVRAIADVPSNDDAGVETDQPSESDHDDASDSSLSECVLSRFKNET